MLNIPLNPEAIFFDFDGVICDSVNVKTLAFEHLYLDQPDTFRDVVRAYHLAHGGISRYEKIRHYEQLINGGEPDQAVVNDKADQFAELVVESVIASDYIPGAYEALMKLHIKCPLFVVSGTPQDELSMIVERRGLTSLFQGVYGTPRKKAEILQSILTDQGLNARQTVMIGDAMTDYSAAIETGVPFIGVTGVEASPFPAGTREIVDLRSLPGVLLGN